MKTPVYMDCHATTPMDTRVMEAMLPYFMENFGNPASRTHVFGWRALEAVEAARTQVAKFINAAADEIVFTSGATESINLALKGVAEANRGRGDHLVTSAIEHKVGIDVCRELEKSGFNVTYLPVAEGGLIDPEQVRAAITDRTILVSIMYANNEIGTIQPIEEIGRIAGERGVIFHVDAAQACGRISVEVERDGISLLSISGHKFYAPKGIGALYVRRHPARLRIAAQMHGGGHERGLRSGTLNVPGIVGLGKACEISAAEMHAESERITEMRDLLNRRLHDALDGIQVNGSMDCRLPGNLNVSFARVEGESLLMSLRDVAVSSGSACTSASAEPSHVLRSIGCDPERTHSSIRFGLGRFTTAEEVEYTAQRVIDSVQRLREMSPA